MAANTGQRKKVDPNRWPGIFAYESERKLFQGKPDACYYILYKVDSKKRMEKVGWKSEGYTPQVAAEIRADRMKQIRHGEEVKTSKEIQRDKRQANRDIDEIAAAYFATKQGERWRRIDENRYKKHISPLLGQKSVRTLCSLDVARVKQNMKGLSAASVWGALEILRRVVNYGAKVGMCPRLAFVIEMPKKDNEVVEYLAPEEAARLMRVLDEWPTQDAPRMLKLAMFTGMRRGEIFKLQDRDLDFRVGFITLRAPKGGKTASIPMNQVAREILEEQIRWRDEQWPESPQIFPGNGGRQRTDCNAVARIKEAAGLPESFRIFHGLRHHFAVTLANSGKVPLDMIGELLTHKSMAMTKRYGQFLPGTLKKAGDLAAELLSQGLIADEGTREGKTKTSSWAK